MILRFALTDKPDIITTKVESNFMDVYDHKLLWRANLYLDETKNPATGAVIPGAVDWNNANPWTFQQGNEWDKFWDAPDGEVEQSGPNNGGQCPINPWTRPYDPDSTNFTYPIQTEYASVAYTELGRDTPFDFNADLNDQKNAIKIYGGLPTYTSTLAPTNGDWLTYIDHTKLYNGVAVNTAQYFPYRPVFSSIITHMLNDGDSFNNQAWAGMSLTQSAGIFRRSQLQRAHDPSCEL